MKKLYPRGQHAVKGGGARARAGSVSIQFLARVASDPDLHDNDIRYLLGLLGRMTMEGHGRGTDEDLEKATTVAVKSQPACLSRLARGGYLLPSRRKNSGQRDTTLAAQFLPALRRHGRFRQEEQAEWAGGSRADSATQRNSPPSEEENPNKKTPNSEESLTYAHEAHEAREARREETQGGSESLDCDSSSSVRRSEFLDDVPRAGEHSLADLAERYGVGHFCLDVIQAADCFGDLAGAAHYNMVYTTMALCGQEVWAKAVESVLTRWRAGEIRSPRPYIGTTVQGILAERDKVLTERERLAMLGLFRKCEVDPLQAWADEEFDALILVDPFADSPTQTQSSGARAPEDESRAPEDEAHDSSRQAPEEKIPDQSDFVEVAEKPVEAAPARPRPMGLRKPAVKVVADEEAVVKAQERLGSWAKLDFLRSLYTGACKGRAEVFELIVSVAERDGVSSNAFLLKVANIHVADDAQLLLALAEGKTAAECTEKLIEFEDRLLALKSAKNRPITSGGAFRADQGASLKDVLGAVMPVVQGRAEARASVSLPTTDAARVQLQEDMTAMRGAFSALSFSDQESCRAAGRELANGQAGERKTNQPLWDQWFALGVYHEFLRRRDAAAREENICVAREPITQAA